MFMLKSIGKALWGSDPSKLDIIQITSGQLYLVRPGGIKSLNECIFKDAQATVRRTNTQFHYQLVIERVFEEGEEDLSDDDGEAYNSGKDEKTFLLDENLHFAVTERDHVTVLSWKDASGVSSVSTMSIILSRRIREICFSLSATQQRVPLMLLLLK